MRSEEIEEKLEFNIEIYIIEFLRINWKMLILCASLGIVLSTVVSFFVPREWSASAIVQIGQYVEISNDNAVVRYIESANSSAVRINSPGFQDKVIDLLKINDATGVEARLIRDWLKASPVPMQGDNFVKITVRGQSPEQAKEILRAANEVLANEHQEFFDITTLLLKKNMANNAEDIAADEEKKAMIFKVMSSDASENSGGRKFSESVVLNFTLGEIDNDIARLKNIKNQQEMADSKVRSFNTGLFTSVAVPRSADFPKVINFIIGGLLLGFLTGVFASRFMKL